MLIGSAWEQIPPDVEDMPSAQMQQMMDHSWKLDVGMAQEVEKHRDHGSAGQSFEHSSQLMHPSQLHHP